MRRRYLGFLFALVPMLATGCEPKDLLGDDNEKKPNKGNVNWKTPDGTVLVSRVELDKFGQQIEHLGASINARLDLHGKELSGISTKVEKVQETTRKLQAEMDAAKVRIGKLENGSSGSASPSVSDGEVRTAKKIDASTPTTSTGTGFWVRVQMASPYCSNGMVVIDLPHDGTIVNARCPYTGRMFYARYGG